MIHQELPNTIASPLRVDANGVIRVAGTRVPLETVVAAYENGLTAEEILQDYTSLPLDDIYAVIAYYLKNRESLQPYLERRREEFEATRRELEARFPNTGLRDRLLARRRAIEQVP